MPRFDRERIRALLEVAGDCLHGEWILGGGAAAAMWFTDRRTTEDIDMVAIDGSNAERLAVIDVAVSLGYPVEAISSTIDYFIRRIADWREHLVVLHRGTTATIYRPDATVYLELKMRRLSETDLADCLELCAHADASDEAIDRTRLIAVIDALPATDDARLAQRRAALRQRLAA